VVCRVSLIRERQLEFVRNLRPEFAEDIESHVLDDTVAYRLRRGCKSAFVARVIGVAQYDGARCLPSHSEKLNMRLLLSRLRYKHMLNSCRKRWPPVPLPSR